MKRLQIPMCSATKWHRARSTLLLAGILLLTACAATVREERSDARPMPPDPRPAPVVPDGTHASKVALQVAPKPRDTNGNGFPDVIELYAYLFADDHAAPFYEDGTFIFDLYLGGQTDVPGAEPIKTWSISGAALEAAKGGVNIIGKHYAFRLSMLEGENPTDRYPLIAADLTARFEPGDGRPPIIRRDIHRLQIGSTNANR